MTLASVLQQLAATMPQHVRRHPLRYLLSLFSISVAVMLFVSMRITQESIVHAFHGNIEALAGKAQYRIVAPAGVEEAILIAVEKIPGVTAAPVVQAAIVLALALFAVPHTEALAFSILLHAAQYFPVTIYGLILLLVEQVSLSDATRRTPTPASVNADA